MMTIKQSRLAIVAAFAAALAMPVMGNAQEDEGPNWLQVRIVNLQANGSAKWVELQKQLVAAERDENIHRDVWQVIRGELDTFHIVSQHKNLAEFDEQGEGAALGDAQADWVAAITPTIASRTQTLSRIHADLSIPAAEDAKRNLLILRYNTVMPGQGDAYQNWVKSDLRPALVKGGITGVNFSRVAFGANVDTWVSASYLENWTAMDGPGPLAYLSEEEDEALFAAWSDMLESREIRVLRYREDLSY
jgi:hypothetical protein